jgi:hypothetical protein
LKRLERRFPIFIEDNQVAVDNGAADRERCESVDERVEALPEIPLVAGPEASCAVLDDSNAAKAVPLYFVMPVLACWQFRDELKEHRLNVASPNSWTLLLLFGGCFPGCFALLVSDFVRLFADTFGIRFFLGWIISHNCSSVHEKEKKGKSGCSSPQGH